MLEEMVKMQFPRLRTNKISVVSVFMYVKKYFFCPVFRNLLFKTTSSYITIFVNNITIMHCHENYVVFVNIN